MALFKILRGNAANLPTTKKDGYAYFCTDTHDFYIDYTNASGELTRGQLNAYQADKLSAGRKITLDTAVTTSSNAPTFDGSQNITIPVTGVKEAYLTWGGKNYAGNYGPMDAAMISTLGANRLAFLPEAGITIEYSRDSGATWTEIETENKHRLFGAFGNNYTGFIIGNNDIAGADTSTYQLRITIDSIAANVYTSLNKFAIYTSTGGGQNCWCTIECKTVNNVISGTDTWVNFANQVPILGWSGWNIINTQNITTHSGYESQQESGQYQKIRFIFGNDSHSGNYKGLQILQILGFGGVGWKTPSYMAKYGSLYSYDCEQNATFPKNLTSGGQLYSKGDLKVNGASTLTGAVTSGALTASSLKSNGALTVTGNSTFTGTITANGNVTLGNSSTGDTTTLTSKLVANGTSNFKAAMTATSITASSTVTASGFIGDLTGNADTATEAEQAEAIEWMYFNDSGVIS